MRRIAGEEAPSLGKFVDVSRVNFVRREPVHICDVELQPCIAFDLLFDLFIKNIAFIL